MIKHQFASLEMRTNWLVVLTLLHALSIGIFIRGFLLTRIHLNERSSISQLPTQACPAPFTKLVFLMIDALR